MDSILDSLTSALFGLMALFSNAPQQDIYFGYVEGDYLYMAARQDGYIDLMEVKDGQTVSAGDLLFTLDSSRQADTLAQAQANLDTKKADLADKSYGARSEELAEIEARQRQAEANLALARITFKRTRELVTRKALPVSRLDTDQAALNEARATLAETQAQLAAARLPARNDQMEMSRKAISAAEADVSRAATDLSDRSLFAPAPARVDQVFLYPGEFAKAGTPVLSLLPPDRIKIKFYVPEPVFAQIHVGDTIAISCSGCPQSYEARVSFLASDAEYTPPVIFSREERNKLVFMVEAIPQEPTRWHPGQPVDVSLKP